MALCNKITLDSVLGCTDRPVQGIEQRVVLINYDDLPKTGITYSTTTGLTNSLITNIALLATKKGFMFEWPKNVMGYDVKMEASDTSLNGFKHSLTGIRLSNTTPLGVNEKNQFVLGARFYAVIERKSKGTNNADAFLFLGATHGLEISEYAENSKENDGLPVISLGTPSGYVEPFAPAVLLLTSYAATSTAFNNKFQA